MMRPLTVIGGVLGVAVGLSGCAQGPGKDVTPPPAPAFTPAAAGESVSPASVMLGAGSDVSYKAMGEVEGALHVTRVEDSSAPGRQWTVTQVMEGAGAKPRERTVTLVLLDDGSLAMSREVNKAERVIVDFEPPLVVYAANLRAGEPIEQKLKMIVRPINDPAKVQNQGNATQTLRLDGRETIETPQGKLDAIKTTATLEAELGGPVVLNETQEWLVPGIGLAAIKQMERTTVFGVRVRANNEWWVVKK